MGPTGTEIDELKSLTERSRGLLESLRARSSEAVERGQEDLERFESDATRLIDQVTEQIAGELSDELKAQSEERVSAEQTALDGRRATLDSEQEALRQEKETLAKERSEAERQHELWVQEKAAWEGVRDQVESELAAEEQRIAAEARRLSEEGAGGVPDETWAERERLLEEDRARADSERDEYAAALEEANKRLAAAQQLEQEHARLAEKLEAVLQDLGEHRDHVARLEEELAARPEPDESQGAELAQLRTERDDLVERLRLAEEAAERATSSATPPDEVADLTRRFQLAVEDVRQLKAEKGDLEERLRAAEAQTVAAPTAPDDANDWEAQKRRMLASLEGEGEVDPQDDAPRAEERATIAGTIQITDGVVAEKDREIERLREALAESEQPAGDGSPLVGSEAAETLDNDQLVQAERQRLAGLEQELHEKLRSAELELSLERAKIARAQSEIAEKQMEIETLRANQPDATPGDSRRKWLDKLGLGGEQG